MKTAEVIEKFSEEWPEDRIDYRMPGDDSWKAYGLALRDLVVAGDSEAGEVVKGLSHPNRQVRALCARALGFLKVEHTAGSLRKSLFDDAWETVRLIFADSLGMLFTQESRRALKDAAIREKHKDVKLHINIASRREHGLENEAKEMLLQVNSEIIDSAVLEQESPDFTLETSEGKEITLSAFRGKTSVMLVFLYGDG